MSAPERDDLVAEALRDLPVPDHRPGFWSALDRAIAADESGSPATDVPRLDTGELPSVRSLAHERPRRRRRGPWLAVAAALIVLAGAVGVVTLAGDLGDGDDDGADLAGGSGDAQSDSASTVPRSGDETTTIAVPETGSVLLATSPVDTVQQWIDALGAGDREAAAALLGPRSREYAASIGGDPVGLMVEYEEGFGGWAGAADLQLAAVEVGPLDLLGPGASLTLVTLVGTNPGEGDPAFGVAVIPVVSEGDERRVEPAAYSASRLNQLVFTVPETDDAGLLVMPPDGDINVFAPVEGTVFFQIDGGELYADATSPVGRNAEPFALYNPRDDLAAGTHQLVVAAVGADGTITAFAGTFEVRP